MWEPQPDKVIWELEALLSDILFRHFYFKTKLRTFLFEVPSDKIIDISI
jgi:hypothetical protein